MRVVIQRVLRATVTIDGKEFSAIGPGLLVFAGIEEADGREDIEWLTNKIVNLRVFNDENGVMNRSLLEMGGDLLVVSQFTLHASTKKGNRPSYIRAARPELAVVTYEQLVKEMSRALGKPISTGSFGADMKVDLLNDGPVSIWIDSRNRE